MQRLVWLSRLVLAAAVGFILAQDVSAAPDAQFRTAKRVFQQKMRSRTPADRAAALRNLQPFDSREAVELVANPIG